jgi:CheY-like chemotaxis protein
VDPVPASRRALAEVLAGSDRALATVDGLADALDSIRASQPALILVSRDLRGEDGLELLRRLQSSHPEIERVLVMEGGSGEDVRRAIVGADLAFVVRKPWHPESLRQTVSDILAAGRRPQSFWRTLPAGAGLGPSPRSTSFASGQPSGRIHSLAHALLTRLNSCERETEILRLLHVGLGSVCRLRRWLWVGEKPFRSIRIGGRSPSRVEVAECRLDGEEWDELERLRRRLDENPLGRSGAAGSGRGDTVLGITVFLGTHGRLFGLAWADPRDADQLLRLLRELQPGLQNALYRVLEAESRAQAARRLARRVSDDLRGPAGVLVHAVDRLRLEAERSGVPSVWLEQVSAESHRVMEAVAHFESELIVEPVHRVAS